MKKESFKTSKPEPYNFSNNLNSLELNLYNAKRQSGPLWLRKPYRRLSISSQRCTHAPLHTEQIQIQNQRTILVREPMTSPSDSTSFLLFVIYCAF